MNEAKNYWIVGLVILLIVAAIVVLELRNVENNNGSSAPLAPTGNSIYPKAPELTGISGYINSGDRNTGDNLTIASLRGKVVIIDFWTYSCINCLRTLPYLNSWYDKYHDDGLVIIGVHTPEFDFEKDYDNVAMAVKKYGIRFPVVLDNDYGTWNAYSNQYWPRKYIIDKNGYVRFNHIGEGGYDETEKQIQQLLSENSTPINVPLSNIADQTPTTQNTGELYLGYQFAIPRGENVGNDGGLNPEVTQQYNISTSLRDNTPYLDGEWISKTDTITSAVGTDKGTTNNNTSSLYLKFTAMKAHIVVQGPIGAKVYVTVDNQTVNTDDVHDGYFTIDGPRLYTVYDGPYGTYTLRLYTNIPDIGFNSFTFG